MTSKLATAVLKNVKSEDATSGVAVMALIMAEANRREHLAGGVIDANWNRAKGIGILVEDEGQMMHLANALGAFATVHNLHYDSRLGRAYGRTGLFAGFSVTVWYVDV